MTEREELLPCPFCDKPLQVKRGKINPAARCVTEDCFGAKMSVVNLDVPSNVKAWNTRAPRHTTTRNREQIAECIWRAEYKRATCRDRIIEWSEVNETDKDKLRFIADAILALTSVETNSAPPPPAANMLDDETIVGLIRKSFNDQAYRDLTYKRWKDGIDIDYPTFAVEQFVKGVLSAAPQMTAPHNNGERDLSVTPDCGGAETDNGLSPIETAPRDGTVFVGVRGKLAFATQYGKYYVKWPHEEGGPTYYYKWNRICEDSIAPWQPTHWMPLPAPPSNGGVK